MFWQAFTLKAAPYQCALFTVTGCAKISSLRCLVCGLTVCYSSVSLLTCYRRPTPKLDIFM